MNRSATGAVAAGFAVATPEWFDAVNGHLGRRAARGPDEPLFADLELTRFGGHLTSWEDVHDAEGKAAVSA